MVSTAGRRRAETSIRRSLDSGQRPWVALDAYRARGGPIRWDDWFRLWRRLAHEPVALPAPAITRAGPRRRR